MIAVPLLGKRSDDIGYRRVLLICLAGATLTSFPQALAGSYWTFVVERFVVGFRRRHPAHRKPLIGAWHRAATAERCSA